MTQPTVSKRKIGPKDHASFPPGPPHHVTIIQHAVKLNTKYIKYTNINTNESLHSEMGQVRKNPIQRTVRTAHLSVLTTVHNFSTQYSTEQFR